MERTILHCDMNNFFASVECVKNPTLAGKPMAVCGNIENRHGIILAKNPLAKAFGITTGEPVVRAQAKCRHLIIVEADYDEYIRYSASARKIYDEYTDLVEPLGIDECWLDVTGSRSLFGDGEKIANILRERIKAELGVTISVGVSFNKIFAKLGSDMKKPDAVTCISQIGFREKIWKLPVCELFGVGDATCSKLKSCGIFTIGQLANAYPPMIKRKLGINGLKLIEAANGRDNSPVVRGDAAMEAKSISRGTTAYRDLQTPEEVWTVTLALCEEIGHALFSCHKKAFCVGISVRDCRLNHFQYQHKLTCPTDSYSVIAKEAFSLFAIRHHFDLPLRSVTVAATELCPENIPIQTDMFSDSSFTERSELLDRIMDRINNRFGKNKIRYGVLFGNYLSDVKETIGFAKTN